MKRVKFARRNIASMAECERAGEGDPKPSPIDALFTNTQRRLLGLLFGQTDRAFQVCELVEITGGGSGATHRELWRLQEAGLLRATGRGRRVFFQADPKSPIHAELASLVRKTVGIAEPVREAFAPLAAKLQLAFVIEPWGGVPADRARELQLVLVVEPGQSPSRADLEVALDLLEQRFRCPVNHPLIVEPDQLRPVLSPRLDYVLKQPRVWVHGSEAALASLRGQKV
jgi:hypothetical protein